MFEQIQEIISEVTTIDKNRIKPDSLLFKELDIDSLDLFEIADRIESKFNIEIDGYDIQSISTVNDIISALDRHINFSNI